MTHKTMLPMCMRGARRYAVTRNRSGYSLIEMLIVISVISIVLATVAVALHTLVNVNRQIRDELPNSAMFTRLALQVRGDAHQALQFAADVRTDGTSLARFTLRDESVALYETKPAVFVRRLMRGEQQVHQEVFRIGRETSYRWSTRDEPRTIVTLSVRRRSGKFADAAGGEFTETIDAALGLDADVKR